MFDCQSLHIGADPSGTYLSIDLSKQDELLDHFLQYQNSITLTMKKLVVSILLILSISIEIFSQRASPDALAWGLYASGIGERLSPCMDPCWVTYTVAQTNDASVQTNLDNGTMAAVVTGVTYHEASAQQRRFGRYFDDQPDGTWKCSPCEVPPPDLSCPWNSPFGKIYWNQGYYGNKTKTIRGKLKKVDGKWVYEGTWGRTNSNRSGKVRFTFNSATSFTGYYTHSTSTKQNAWRGSGSCN